MKCKVTYKSTVCDDGERITNADVTFSEKLLNDIQLTFLVGENEVAKCTIQRGKEHAQVDFPQIPALSMLSFDKDKFVNNIVYPNIVVKVDNGVPLDSTDVKFERDSFIKKFKHCIVQGENRLFSYYEYEPINQTNNKLPLVIFLHGSGERGNMNKLPLLGSDIPKTLLNYVEKNEEAIIVVPQTTWSPRMEGWFRPEYERLLLKMIERFIAEKNVDSQRIYLTGLSNGGSEVWHLIVQHPNIFAAAVPCSGYIYNPEKTFHGGQGSGRYMKPTENEIRQVLTLPIWTFHEEDDPVVNVAGTHAIVDGIRKLGGTNIKATFYAPGTNKINPHASWEKAYNNQELLPWLFSQRRK